MTNRQTLEYWLTANQTNGKGLPSWNKFLTIFNSNYNLAFVATIDRSGPTPRVGQKIEIPINELFNLAFLEWRTEDGSIGDYISALQNFFDWNFDHLNLKVDWIFNGNRPDIFFFNVANLGRILQKKEEIEKELTNSTDLSKKAIDILRGELENKNREITNIRNNLESEIGRIKNEKEQQLTILSATQQESTTKQEKINNLEREIRELKDLKVRLETDFEQREQDLLTELDQIKQQKTELETKLQDHETNLTNTKRLLDQKSSELSKEKLEIERQKQLLSEKEQELAEQKGISQQNSEEIKDLKKQLTIKEKEFIYKNNELSYSNQILTELDEEKVQLDQELRTSQKKIKQLEQKISDLKSNSNQEAKNLKSQINQLHQKQTELKSKLNSEIQKNKDLQRKYNRLLIKGEENHEEKGFWNTIKTPLVYLGGGTIVLIGLGWIYSKPWSEK